MTNTNITYFIVITLFTACIFSCNGVGNEPAKISQAIDSTMKQVVEKIAPPQQENLKPAITYRWIKKKEWQALKDSFEGIKHIDILNAINRVDEVHLKRLDSILVPSDYSRPLKFYLPFPDDVALLKEIKKILIFSYPTQTFAAYENGKIMLTGPTNMGKKSAPTPRGLFFTNWKAKKSISTPNNEWILKWNFNVSNKAGVGFHEYALPGYPASHSCMRLLSSDAQFLYNWANQWILKNSFELLASGTPVIVYGTYPFGKTKPWYEIANNPQALNISADSLAAYIQPYLKTILQKQQQRESVTAAATQP